MNDVLKLSSDEELTKESILKKLDNIENSEDAIFNSRRLFKNNK